MSELNYLDQRLVERAAKEWALEAHGWRGARGGWINDAAGEPFIQGWYAVSLRYRADIFDWLTARLTAFDSLQALLGAPGYRPTILVRGPRDWRYHLLGDVYDWSQRKRKDARRAHRGVAATAQVV